MSKLNTIPARHGVAASVKRDQHVKVVNTHGNQVVDTWVFNADDLSEYQSNEHTRPSLMNLSIELNDFLYTNRRRPIVQLVEDTSPGVHDMLMPACDRYRYQLLGCTEYHRNCVDNLRESMNELGHDIETAPSPINLFMNIPWAQSGNLDWGAPVSKPGDFVVLRAIMDCIIAFSACPQDLVPVNGHNPVDAHFQIY